jgi:hypothetical protein
MIKGYRLGIEWEAPDDGVTVERSSYIESTLDLMEEIGSILRDTGTKSELSRITIEVLHEEDIILGEEPW